MDAYHVALFFHVVSLIVAAGATAVTKLAVGRRIRPRTVGDALEWHDLLISASKLFPVCLALFLGTGAYMVSVVGLQAWSTGFVVAGLTGVVMLLGSGTYLGDRDFRERSDHTAKTVAGPHSSPLAGDLTGPRLA